MTTEIRLPEMGLVVLVGVTGSGKSHFARKHFAPTQVVSSDRCRGMVSDDENDQSATGDAFDLLHYIVAKRLRRGQIDIDATIDLHGMRQNEAREALQRFVPARVTRGDRTVLVITGKGLRKADGPEGMERGVLRAMLPVWLSEPGLSS